MNLRREFVVNILWLIGLNVLIKPFFIFGIDRQVQNTVGEVAYGQYFALLSWAFLIQILADAGIQQLNSNHTARHPVLINRYLSLLLPIKLVLGGLFTLILVGIAQVTPAGQAGAPLIYAIAATQVGMSLLLYLRTNVAALGFYRTDSFLSICDRLLAIMFCGLPLWIWPHCYTIEWFALGQLVAVWVTLLVAALWLIWQVGWPRHRVRIRHSLRILRQSLPYAAVILAMSVYSRLDAVLLDWFSHDAPARVGIYAAAYRLLDAANMLGYIFSTLLLPMLARLFQHGGAAAASPLVYLSNKIIFTISITLAALLTGLAPTIMLLLYHKTEPVYATTLSILAWTHVAVSGIYIYVSVLTVAENLRLILKIAVFGAIFSLLLGLCLVPHFGVTGAAATGLATHISMVVALAVVAHKRLDLVAHTSFWLQSALFLCVMLAASMLVRAWQPLWFIGAATIGCTGLLLAMLMGWLPLQQIKTMLLNKQDI
jgi:O-antigen/teichoic acid export membrane protein